MNTVNGILDTKGRDVYSVAPDDTVLAALKLMAEHDVGALAVIENNQIIGLISERNYARKVILKGKLSKDTRVREIMEERVICINPRHSVDACMALMTEYHTRHLPVLEQGQLVGIISIGDIVKSIIDDQQFTIEQLEHYITGTP
jgi:CBS domain-containing protein